MHTYQANPSYPCYNYCITLNIQYIDTFFLDRMLLINILVVIASIFCVASPKIVTQPADTSAAAPFSGVFTCSVSGYGYPNITWYRRSGILPTKHKVFEKISHGVITSTLVIPNVSETDVGKYYCQVWANKVGVKSKTADLYYSGKHYVANCKYIHYV